ncbi:MAG TPA: type IV toxin-antitoxin system AbiEi family antitoxin domain-containing protein [Solirubrobacterales bacterium]|nr:type IV toxin-antitoxin system AbiEi family antitoxin domain-containing protein [Solirubrobacterales bacterium]
MRPISTNGDRGSGECHVRGAPDPVERAIAALAERQHGIVTRQQLLATGLGAEAIKHRARRGWMQPVHRSVYLVGLAPLTMRGREIAAVRACGPTAILGHRSAACFWEMLPYPADFDRVSVIVTNRNIRSKPGIAVHRSTSLARRDYVLRDGIPVTTPPRTILDLASVAPEAEVERAIAEGYAKRILSERQLIDQLERNAGRPGVRLLRELLEVDGGVTPTRSEAERRMLAVLRAADVPLPEVNARLDRYEVDFLWRDHRLVLEVDGFATHSSRASFEADRVRDARLAAFGYAVIRVTWRQLVRRPEAFAARLAAALAVRAGIATTAPLAGTATGGE